MISFLFLRLFIFSGTNKGSALFVSCVFNSWNFGIWKFSTISLNHVITFYIYRENVQKRFGRVVFLEKKGLWNLVKDWQRLCQRELCLWSKRGRLLLVAANPWGTFRQVSCRYGGPWTWKSEKKTFFRNFIFKRTYFFFIVRSFQTKV